ncbi:CidA/LrgA family protein [Roseateles cavernae]|uniref:CidA/LrgA family protein n=1 Tax=Roseateles cavernae TaxID=3153578 RepID=UPI0032E36E37
MDALRGLTILLLCQSAGELLTHVLALGLPGPVLGMLILMLLLRLPITHAPVQAAAEGLLAHLSLLFVPVGVGVITHLDLIATHGPRLALAVLGSTLIGLAVSASVLQLLLSRGREAQR